MPLVTVLMSVYNGQPFVRQAVESILQQTMPDLEFLIINDCSTDDSGAVLDSFKDRRVRVIHNERNVGLTRSLNIGLAEARGVLVARQDADDLSRRDRLEKQVEFLECHPEVALVGTQAVRDERTTAPVSGWPKATTLLGIRWQLMFDSPFFHTSVMFRHHVVWDQFGGYDPEFRTSQDFELWSRLAAAHELRNLPTPLVVARARRGSVSGGYRREDVKRVRDLLLQNRQRWLRSEDLATLGLDPWVVVNNLATVGPLPDVSPLARADTAMFHRFIELHAGAAFDEGIRRHRAVSLARVACVAARHEVPGSGKLFAHAFRIDPSTVASWSVRYAASLLLGLSKKCARAGGGQ
jgi:glycosyltransferase involved in cell wall biosynthesis